MRIRTAWTWIVLGAATFGLHLAMGRDSALIESLYSRGLFVAWRWIWDQTLGRSPIPWIYLLTAALLIAAAVRIRRSISGRKTRIRAPRPKAIGRALLGLAAGAGAGVFFFYLLWGFNYDRVGLEKQMKLEPPPPDAAALAAEASWAARVSAEARAAIPGSSPEILAKEALPGDLESAIRGSLVAVLRRAGYPAAGRVRVRSFVPGGWMMRFSSTGIYVPFFSEGYLAASLLPFEKPFTMAHEMAHGYGITDEGAANLLAFLACAESGAPIVRYSGFASFWSYAAGELSRDAFKASWLGLSEGMRADILAARQNAARYRGALDRISRTVYSQYLKSQGIREGMKSYSRFVGLVAAWKRKNPDGRLPE